MKELDPQVLVISHKKMRPSTLHIPRLQENETHKS